MKKVLIGFLAIALLISLTGLHPTKASFNVTVGSTYGFEVIKSKISAVQGTVTGQGIGISFAGSNYPVDIDFSVEVTAASASTIDYSITLGTDTIYSQNTDYELEKFQFLLYYQEFIVLSPGVLNPASMALGLPIMNILFIEPTTIGHYFQDLHDQTQTTSIPPRENWEFDERGANYDTTSTIVVFDWVCNGKYVNETADTEFGGFYYFKVAFDKTTGEMKGYKWLLEYNGTINGLETDVKIDQKIELRSYDLETFYFTDEASGFRGIILIHVLVIISTISFLINRINKIRKI
jgi:hypothetical protein